MQPTDCGSAWATMEAIWFVVGVAIVALVIKLITEERKK